RRRPTQRRARASPLPPEPGPARSGSCDGRVRRRRAGWGAGEAAVEAEVVVAVADAVHEVGDPLLQAGEDLLLLRLGEPPGGDGGVDPVLERLLQRRAERARRDAELLRRVVHDRLAVARRAEAVGRERGAAAGDRRGGRHTGADLQLELPVHLVSLRLVTDERTTGR